MGQLTSKQKIDLAQLGLTERDQEKMNSLAYAIRDKTRRMLANEVSLIIRRLKKNEQRI